jgi:hypothetical protein
MNRLDAEDEVKVRRLMALLEREFGPVDGARPKLRLAPVDERAPRHEVMVCEAKAVARKLWPGEFDTKPALTLIQGGRAS